MDSYFSLTNVAAAAISLYALLGTIFFNRKSRPHQENKTTASSSSLTLLAPPSSLPNNWKHHVFPSFHGADVRTNFLSHVLKEFRSKGIDLFIDKDIERTKSIGPALTEAIRGSRIAIVLLSKNYASSTWCLNELVEIMKCREEFGQTVMSLFYQVNPTDVKKQTGDFGKVFKKTCKGKTKEEIRRWKHALTEVAQIAGYHSTNWETEAEMIEVIVTDVSNKLNNSAPSSDFDGLVGMESHMEKMEPLLRLDSNKVRRIGILGPPGIGKSTIARSLFNRHSQDFQLSVFIDNIKRNYATPAGSDDYSVKLNLQKLLMSQLTNEKDFKISHLGIAQDRLKDKKVLVVLDDVDQSVVLEAMANETSWFGPGSRIIVTTQDQKVLKANGINHIHRVNLPSDLEAFQMLCMYAFGQEWCKDGFSDLAWKVIRVVGKLPLGLRVIGSYFRGMSEQDWIEELPRLRTHLEIDGEISSILKFSYDALRNEEKRLFLHIACFFDYERVDILKGCLAKCFSDVKHGLRVLAEKSLISIEYGRIHMAELLVQLGRKIVREQSISELGKHQFLNEPADIDEILSDDKSDSGSVIGIYLNEDIACTSERAFERLYNLQFLRIHGSGVNTQSMNYISQKLRVLAWRRSTRTCFPSSFNPKVLVKLEMQDSELEKLWEDSKPLSNLKWMDLSWSKKLEELPDLSSATSLQELNLSYCSSLVKLPFSIGNAINLQKLNLSNCSSLVELPSSFGNIVSLRKLKLRKCSRLVELPYSMGNAINLQILNLSHCSSLVELPHTIGNATNLKEMNLRYCSSLVELPLSIGNAINLRRLKLRRCSSLVKLPSSMRNLSRLWYLELMKCSKLEVNLANVNLASLHNLNLSGCSLLKIYPESSTNIEELLDPWIGRVSRLRRLVLRGMKKLVSLPQLPDSILFLDAENCESLERLDCSFGNPDISLNFANCFKLNQEARNLIIQMRTNEYAIFPADEEVPQCFTYRSFGSSLAVKLNQTLPLGTSTIFKACILCAAGEDEEDFGVSRTVHCNITFGGNTHTGFHCHNRGLILGNLCTFEAEVRTEEVTSTELLFDFEVKKLKIKECGILQLLEVPLLRSFTDVVEKHIENFGDVVEDFEPSDDESIRDRNESYETSEEETSGNESYEEE